MGTILQWNCRGLANNHPGIMYPFSAIQSSRDLSARDSHR